MKIDIVNIAQLANLTLEKDEIELFQKQISEVFEYVRKLDGVKTENIEPTSQVTGLENVLREDKTAESLSQDKAISQSTATHNGFFQVKGILENE